MTYQDLYAQAQQLYIGHPYNYGIPFVELPLSKQLTFVNKVAHEHVKQHLMKHGITEAQEALGRAYDEAVGYIAYDSFPFESQCNHVAHAICDIADPYYYHTALAVLNA